jgi:hypothetical protein
MQEICFTPGITLGPVPDAFNAWFLNENGIGGHDVLLVQLRATVV